MNELRRPSPRHRTAALVLASVLAASPFASARAADLLARLDRATSALGESVTLTLAVAGDDAAGAVPDLTPLERDFDVLGTASGSTTRIVNGARSDSRHWTISLAPKRTGRLTVPPLNVGDASSEPLAIEVTDAPAAGEIGAAGTGIALEVDVAEGTHHVHEEIPLTLRITDASGMLDATLEEPSDEAFTLTHTGEDITRQVAGAAGPVNVTERRYVLRARAPGELVIPSLTLRARVADPNARDTPFAGMPDLFARAGFGRSPFGGRFDRGREIVVRSAPVTIDVLEPPIGDGEWFLPARRVELEDAWTSAAPSFRVGEATRRTIRLVALGASAEQLPTIDVADVDGARVYVDATRERTVDTAEGSAAVHEMDVSIVPTRAGEITLPAIDVAWWNTEDDTERTATLPARTVRVEPVAGASGVPVPDVAAARSPDVGADVGADGGAGTDVDAPTYASSLAAHPWLMFLGLSALVAAAGSWFVGRRAASPAGTAIARVRPAVLVRDVERACRANEPRRAREALSRWLSSDDAARSRGDVREGDADGGAFERERHRLETALYADPSVTDWDGAALLAAFRDERRARRRARGRTARAYRVPALYPVPRT